MITVITKGKNKTHKLCQRCGVLKPVAEFHRNVSVYDGLGSYCKKCMQEKHLYTMSKQYFDLHKRPYPLDGRCEICGIEFGKSCYHHFNDGEPSLGIWVCHSCDYLAEGIDEINRNPWKVDIYHRLKEETEEAEKTYIYSGPYSPPNGIYRLFLNGEQTHKWCPHCGRMRPINQFYKKWLHLADLVTYCKECRSTSLIGCGSRGIFRGLHKRPNPGYCELCNNGQAKLDYHHWDDGNMSKGIWVCSMNKNKCHNFAEAIDKLDNGSLLPDKYSKLKQGIIFGETKVLVGM